MTDRPLYRALGVQPDASQDAIKRAWREAARRLHPDRNPGDAIAAARFREVRAAWAVLGDPERRALYDEFGEDAASAFFDPTLARQAAADAAAHETGSTDSGDLWAHQAAQPIRSRYAVTRGEDLRGTLHLEPLEARRGGHFELVLQPPRPCEACEGTGWRLSGRACSKCEGGTIPGLGPWRVVVPPNVCDGQQLLVRGEGRKGRGHGAEPGDLRVTCRVPPEFVDEADATRVDVPAGREVLLEGGKLRVPQPDGRAVRMSIPPGTRPGQRLRLRGKGRNGGDLVARLILRPPVSDVQAMKVLLG